MPTCFCSSLKMSTYLKLLPAIAYVKCLFFLLVPAEKHGDFLELVPFHQLTVPC